jgi:hypothetical protein
MKILYLHGYGDSPGGTISDYLEEHGWQVIEPDLPCQNFDQCLVVGHTAFVESEPDVVVGYSQGAAIALNLDTGSIPLVLIAPGWKFRGDATTVRRNTIIVNSEHDEFVSLDDCRELLHSSGLSDDRLIVAGEDHSMFDEEALAAIVEAIERIRLCTGVSETNSVSEEMRPDDASYICDSCGEEIVVPLDLSAGAHQEYVEDCPICCRPNVICVEIDEDGEARVWAEPEQDYE